MRSNKKFSLKKEQQRFFMEFLWEIGSTTIVVGFIAFIVYLNYRDTVKSREKEHMTDIDLIRERMEAES